MSGLKKNWAVFVVLISLILLVSVISYVFLMPSPTEESFYVGITYCGESPEEAKQLIDKVKNYTNLFVLQSGPLQNYPSNITEVGDYAVSAGMHFIVYFANDIPTLTVMKTWLDTYDGHWSDNFLGVYFGDKNGGKMLDSEVDFIDQPTQSLLKKTADGSISCYRTEGHGTKNMTYYSDGAIVIERSETNGQFPIKGGEPNPYYVKVTTRVSYYPDGTVTAETSEYSNATTSPWTAIENYNANFTYEELWNVRAFQTYDETAERFISKYENAMNRYGPQNFTYLTSDYALYWFDYKAGYDVVMTQVGWNHTLAQDIALVRGAANLENKTWGAIITWKYNHPPYLDSGEAIYNQMRTAYEAGAEYIVVFNYADDMTGPYGTLQDEHFEALERFWNDAVQSSAVKKGSIKAEAVLVLPENYGWGMRDLGDKIWGLWGPDEKSQQTWNMAQSLLEEYGFGLDIVYDDSEFPAEGRYSQTYFWNQTG